MPFFGGLGLGGGLGGQSGGTPPQGYDQILQELLRQFPGLSAMQAGAQPAASTASLGFAFPGQNLYTGQANSGGGLFGSTGTGIFEGAQAGQPESVTGGLAAGYLGKSPSQAPLPNTGQPQPGGSPLGGAGPFANMQQMPPMGFEQAQQPQDQQGQGQPLLGAPPQQYDLFGGARAVIGGVQDMMRELQQPQVGGPTITPGMPWDLGQGGQGGYDWLGGFGGEDLNNPSFGGENPMATAPFGGEGAGAAGANPGLMKAILNQLGLGPYAEQIGGGIGGLAGLLQLYQGIRGGNPLSAVTGGLQATNALSGIFGGPTIGSLLSQGGGLAATEAGIGLGAGEAVGGAAGAGAGAGGVLGGAMLGAIPALAVAQLGEWLAAPNMKTGYWNNPIKGGLYSQATSDIGSVNDTLDQLQAFGMDKMPTSLLAALVGPMTNGLLSYYATGQGGRGAIRASDTVTGGTGPMKGQPYTGDGASPEGYTANFTKAQQGVLGLVQELMQRGVPYEQLGQAPVTNDWGQQTMDLANPLQAFYQRGAGQYDPEGARLLAGLGGQRPEMAWQSSGEGGAYAPTGQMETWIPGPGGGEMPVQPGSLTPQALLQAMQGAAPYGADVDTRAGGYLSSMYGGPLWQAFARMGVGGPQMQGLIQQHFDPWRIARTFDPTQLGTALQPVLQPGAVLAPPDLYGVSAP